MNRGFSLNTSLVKSLSRHADVGERSEGLIDDGRSAGRPAGWPDRASPRSRRGSGSRPRTSPTPSPPGRVPRRRPPIAARRSPSTANFDKVSPRQDLVSVKDDRRPIPSAVRDPVRIPATRRPTPSGVVKLPNVNMITEMSDMREANRSYEADLQVIKQSRDLIGMTIDLLKGNPPDRSRLFLSSRPRCRPWRALARRRRLRLGGLRRPPGSRPPAGTDFSSISCPRWRPRRSCRR